ncbi:Ig-like domain-containing protein (plasmid) [Vibrio campbellii]|uniref:Ig-like domain-containing protein n=1 Tax=Vibrio campbellii TaxID=680 RepID=UPI001F07E220|nr:Ig-like domain-containing protein [Vibrio campbellii]UMM06664.1 Ig-like domain-containing protein [Vibrio campbellii]
MILKNVTLGLALSVGFLGSANAALLSLDYESATGKKSKIAASVVHINPSDDVSVSLSGGLDRRVRVELVSGSSVEVSKTSAVISFDDRLTVDGKDYFGKVLKIKKPLDGTYTLRAKILTADNKTLESLDYTLVVDSVAPKVGEWSYKLPYSRMHTDGKLIYSKIESRYIALENVTDSESGIAEIEFETYYRSGPNNGKLYKRGLATWLPMYNRAQIGDGASSGSVGVNYFPENVQVEMELIFKIRDKAGNETRKHFPLYVNNKCGPTKPLAVAVETPGYSGKYLGQNVFSGFKAYVPGEPIQKNPLKVVFRIPNSEFQGHPDGAIYGGYFLGSGQGSDLASEYTDANYSYKIVHLPVQPDGNMNWPNSGYRNGYTWRCHAYTLPNIAFAPQANPPRIEKIEAYIEGHGWVPNRFSAKRGTIKAINSKISKIRVTGEPRSYEQWFDPRFGGPGCIVPVGGTSCEAPVDMPFVVEGVTQLHHNRHALWDAATRSKSSNLITSVWQYDLRYPEVVSTSHDADKKEISAHIVEHQTGEMWGQIQLQSAWVAAVNKETGIETNLEGFVTDSGKDSYLTANYRKLPEGNYEMYVYAKDAYLNITKKKVGNVFVDATPPSIVILNKGTAQFDMVNGLESISIRVEDDGASKIEQVNLKGGPANDDVYLAFRETINNHWALEYPVLFPALQDGEEYTLTVKAVDNKGNRSTSSVTFKYTPPNLFEMGTAKVLPIASKLLNRQNESMAKIVTAELRTSYGAKASGDQRVMFTVRSDADFSVVVHNQTVHPGQTVAFDYPVTEEGKLIMALFPAEDGVEGKADFMLSIPVVSSIYEN